MSLVDVDSWLTEYEACDRLNHELISQLVKREKQQRLSPEYNRITAAIQVGLNQFATELLQLRSKLDTNAKSSIITFEETERRRRQVDKLHSQLQQLRTKYNSSTRTDRASLLGGQSTSQQRSLWQDSSTEAVNPNSANRSIDVEAMKQTQIDILEDQNRGLETLAQTISRQTALATRLGEEVDDQNKILDNLANTMERVDTNVNVETTNIGRVSRQDSTWGYWIVIIILMVAIIIVVLV